MEPRKKLVTDHFCCALCAALGVVIPAAESYAQQFPNPKTAAEVPGPAAGNTMTTAYVQTVGRMAYLWGWALVNNANRHAAFSKAPEPVQRNYPTGDKIKGRLMKQIGLLAAVVLYATLETKGEFQ